MKYSKKYIVFTIIMVTILLINFHVLDETDGELDQFRGAKLESKIWSPMVAADVNGSIITVNIDNKTFTSEDTKIYMDDNRNIMLPVSILTEALNCSVHIYDGTQLLVEKHGNEAQLELDSTDASSNGKSVSIVSPFTTIDDIYYVSLNDLSNLLGYTCSFDISTNTIATVDDSDGVTLYPTSYDLRKKGRISKIRNQGSYGTCWAFAAISAMESELLPERPMLFSVDHMTMCNSFNVNQYDGGQYTMGMAYLAAWQGPVYEEDDPYGDNQTNDTLSPVMHTQEIRIIDGKDYDGIKEAVFKYGGVQTSLYSTIRSSQGSSTYYNKKTNSYCYIGTAKSNHDVVIIGWDDNYSKENFNAPLEGDGAFICQNSWGENFGDNGVFYVSYYDTNIGTHNLVYTGIESTDNYDNIYQSDLCGWVGKMGYDKEDIYGANVFTANDNEDIVAAGFYATASDTEYELYVVENFVDTNSFSHKKKVASGVLEHAGYYTIDFDSPVEVTAGEKYAVVLYVKTPGSIHPMAIEYDSGDEFISGVNLDDGEGYISYNGSTFKNVKEEKMCNLCIKAFSNNKLWMKNY